MTQSSKQTLAVVGLGLMGASLALAVREKYHIVGVARRDETTRQALARNIVDIATLSLAEGVRDADIIVLSTPVRTCVAQLGELATLAKHGAIITDQGSTKADIMTAMDALPDHLRAVGSHPMCGKETAGMEVAEAALFRGRPWIMTRSKRSDPAAFAAIKTLAENAGAITLELDAQRHDRVLAVSSHLPYALALALMTSADQAASSDDMIYRVMAGGFRDTSRVAASDVTMWTDILLSNKNALSGVLRDFQFQLDQLLSLIERADEAGLRAYLAHAAHARRNKVQMKL